MYYYTIYRKERKKSLKKTQMGGLWTLLNALEEGNLPVVTA